MSSSSNARVSSRAERRTATENGSTQPRAPSTQQERGSRNEKPDPRRTQSPQPPASSSTAHRRTASSTQRTNRNVEERRIERVQVTTRETLTRTRSPERRPGPSVHPTERPRAPEASRAYSGDSRPRSSRAEAPPGMACLVFLPESPAG
jgi:gamma-tubulin complex component 2